MNVYLLFQNYKLRDSRLVGVFETPVAAQQRAAAMYGPAVQWTPTFRSGVEMLDAPAIECSIETTPVETEAK